jgi:hypothetical protein
MTNIWGELIKQENIFGYTFPDREFLLCKSEGDYVWFYNLNAVP